MRGMRSLENWRYKLMRVTALEKQRIRPADSLVQSGIDIFSTSNELFTAWSKRFEYIPQN